jgi:hypothetical protein
MSITKMSIILPLIGLVVGALLQYWLGEKKSLRDELIQTRTKAYADYLNSVCQKGRCPVTAREEY